MLNGTFYPKTIDIYYRSRGKQLPFETNALIKAKGNFNVP